MQVTVSHVDTCLPDFVLDHCNGDNEQLLGVSVAGDSTLADVLESLKDEWRNTGDKAPPEADAGFEAALAEIAAGKPSGALFDERLDTPNRFQLTYECPCGAYWYDSSPNETDDDCPDCHTTCSPSEVEDIDSNEESPQAWFRVTWTTDDEENEENEEDKAPAPSGEVQDAYLDRFPPDHRESVERAYADGFADGIAEGKAGE